MKFTHKLAILASLLLMGGCGSGGGDAAAEGGTAPKAAAAAMYKNVVVTNDKEEKTPMSDFKKDTPEIFVTFDMENMKDGTEMKGVWICEKSAVAEPNFKIDEKTMKSTAGMNVGNFSLSKPTAGWPIGDYRVEMFLDGELKETAKFTVGGGAPAAADDSAPVKK